MCDTLNGNPFSCYSLTRASDETIITFYNELPSLIQYFPKHNVLIIGGNMNTQIAKDENDKFCLRNSPNRNGKYLADFALENRFVCLSTIFQRKEGKLLTYTYPNNSKVQVDKILINKK